MDEHGWRWHWDEGRPKEKPHWDVQKPGERKRIVGPNGQERPPDWRFIEMQRYEGTRYSVPPRSYLYVTFVVGAVVVMAFTPIPDELLLPILLVP